MLECLFFCDLCCCVISRFAGFLREGIANFKVRGEKENKDGALEFHTFYKVFECRTQRAPFCTGSMRALLSFLWRAVDDHPLLGSLSSFLVRLYQLSYNLPCFGFSSYMLVCCWPNKP